MRYGFLALTLMVGAACTTFGADDTAGDPGAQPQVDVDAGKFGPVTGTAAADAKSPSAILVH